jgi:hypothetical protein
LNLSKQLSVHLPCVGSSQNALHAAGFKATRFKKEPGGHLAKTCDVYTRMELGLYKGSKQT